MKAVIFDQDGVLVHSSPVHHYAYNKAFIKFGFPQLSYEEYKTRFAGRKAFETVKAIMGEDTDQNKINEFLKHKDAFFWEFFNISIHSIPGIKKFLAELKNNRIPCALASSSRISKVNRILDALGLKNFFNVIVTAEDVQLAKPEPDIFLIAAKKLGVDPKDCIVFEDSISGIRAANRAGMKVILVTSTHLKHEVKEKVYKSIPDFNSLHVSDLDKI